ncbi:hypothetical protein BCR41DRAFT_353585 [Lobosporangium transversale]|uniref:Uncharacterized protein n=1 Tax=Lobosporangium transversale TaxID=64571 RepID=A0A1Y2GPE2_9FUNG|nr:hypothetical protein BCR41DRAFT_353585 [Lobosporangium transversale]ORZ16135.1 hypothetical protein BCR41DRAFT_353585 [Lobosporangium transversale]|eukprot:XP_021881482.1 hypothetical protein BCR41DRAFT_353585 [Lobosporangium transversale]
MSFHGVAFRMDAHLFGLKTHLSLCGYSWPGCRVTSCTVSLSSCDECGLTGACHGSN